MRAALFPGQGAQRPGMGEWFHHRSARARELFRRAGDVLGRDMAELCFRAPASELRDTRQAQVAMVVHSLAGHEVLDEHGWTPDIVAGHSVGELTAAIVAGALGFEVGLQAVARRAELMASVPEAGAMTAVVGLAPEAVAGLCEERAGDGLDRDASGSHRVVVAVTNSATNTVVSGSVDGIEAVEHAARDRGARVSRLPVSHAFHSPLMEPAAAAWAAHLAEVPLAAPRVPVVVNATGRPVTDAASLRSALAGQMTGRVRWHESLLTLRAMGVSTAVEVGDTRVLTAFARGVGGGLRALSLSDRRTLGALQKKEPTLR